MPSAAHMMCWLCNTVIQYNDCRLYGSLVVYELYISARRLVCPCALPVRWKWAMDRHRATPMPINVSDVPVLWCAGCIILSYTTMPSGCMIPWLYHHVLPISHAVGRSYGVPA